MALGLGMTAVGGDSGPIGSSGSFSDPSGTKTVTLGYKPAKVMLLWYIATGDTYTNKMMTIIYDSATSTTRWQYYYSDYYEPCSMSSAPLGTIAYTVTFNITNTGFTIQWHQGSASKCEWVAVSS